VDSTDCSGQQPTLQTGDSTTAEESINPSTPNAGYPHISPTQTSVPEYVELLWKNDYALLCGSTKKVTLWE